MEKLIRYRLIRQISTNRLLEVVHTTENEAFDVSRDSQIASASLAWGIDPIDLVVEEDSGPVPKFPDDVLLAPVAPESREAESRRLLDELQFISLAQIDGVIDLAWASTTPSSYDLEYRRLILKQMAKMLFHLVRLRLRES
jgi:hypothetical protein